MKYIFLYNIVLTNLLCYMVSKAQEPVVDTKYGSVRGTAVQLQTGIVINTFLGIPFAKPPVGDLRFESPVEPDPWESTLDALEPGDACIQAFTSTIEATHSGWDRYSEDCLHLNIYSPQNASNLAVMVFIHGGGYREGANFVNPGYFLAERDVIMVSINYRLAILGFAYTDDATIPGNVGLRDNIQALTFVQENIAAFGGDPNRVTIFGHSAGAGAVGVLIMSPLATGLFHAAILQSGSELSYWAVNLPETNPEDYLISVAAEFGCPTDNNEDMVECLRTIDALELVNTTFPCAPGSACMGFAPVVDGDVLTDTPTNLRNSGEYNKVPEMIGITENEYDLFLPLLFPSIGTEGLSREAFDLFLRGITIYRSQQWPDESRTEDVFKALQFYYADWPYYEDPYSNREMLSKIFTDWSFGHAMDLQAKYHGNDGLPVYQYVYDYKMSNTPLPEWMGVIHGSELFALFWSLMDDNEAAYIHSQANPGYNATEYSDYDKEVSRFVIELWTNFAKYSNPTPEAIDGPGNTTVLWSVFSPSQPTLYYLSLRAIPEVQLDYRQHHYSFWNEYLSYLIYGGNQTLNAPIMLNW